MNLNSILIGSEHPDELVAYYTKLFGKPDYEDGGYAGWQLGDGNLSIGPHSEVHGKNAHPGRLLLNLETADVRGDFARLKAAGAIVIREPYTMDGWPADTYVSTLADPDDNYFQLQTPFEMGGQAGQAMATSTGDPTLDRLLRHMAWANAQLVARLAGQPVEALALTAPRNDWSAGRILAHLLNAAQGYASRMEGVSRPPTVEPPTSAAELADLGARLGEFDARLRRQATEPDVLVAHPDPARPHDLRSTILAQAIHHATEHRAQIAGALSTNGNDAVDLDAIDVWEYADAEG